MTTQPRFLESVLMFLGAKAEYRDAVVGDLAEEFALRAQRDGERSARQWYYREAARAIPHLLGNAARALRWPDVTRLAGIVVTTWVLVVMTAFMATVMIVSTLRRFWPEYAWTMPRPPVPLWLTVVWLVGVGVAGGYVAAWLDTRTPLISALTLGVVWSAIDFLALSFYGPASAAVWYPVLAPALLLPCAVAGGLLHLRSRWRASLTQPLT